MNKLGDVCLSGPQPLPLPTLMGLGYNLRYIGHVFDSETQCSGVSDILSAKRYGVPILSLLPAVQ